MQYKLGLKPVTKQPTLRLQNYLSSSLPTPPLKFGHADLIQPMMLGNDQYGDCAIAGSIEEIRLLNAERGVTVPFSAASALKAYGEITRASPTPIRAPTSMTSTNTGRTPASPTTTANATRSPPTSA